MHSNYQTLAQPISCSYEEKRSEFIAHIVPASNRAVALSHLDQLKKDYPYARHYCWAYIIGDPKQPQTVAFNDDGEPAGTAGKPILHVLTQRGVGDACAIVVRYFGGIKLGAGGLVRAYGQAVSQALDVAIWQEVIAKIEFKITAEYEDEPHVRHFLTQYDGCVLEQGYSEKIELLAQLPHQNLAAFIAKLRQKTGGRCAFKDTQNIDI